MKKLQKFGIVIAICFVVCIAAIIVLGYNNIQIQISRTGFHIVDLREPAGVLSPDGRYRLLEMRDSHNAWMQYTVIENNSRKILYTTGRLFLSRFCQGAYWIGNTHDFCIPDSDEGDHIYLFSCDLTDPDWQPAINEIVF